MDSIDRADGSADHATVSVSATEVDLSNLAAAVADMESPQLASPEPDLQEERQDECVHVDENANENPTRPGLDILVSPRSTPVPQDETSSQFRAHADADEFPESSRVDRGKQSQRVHYSKDCDLDIGFTAVPPVAPDTPPLPDITRVHLDDDLSHSPKLNKGKQPQRFSDSPEPIMAAIGSSSTSTPPPAPMRGPGNPPTSTVGLAHGHPIPWELDPERPAQKLPIRFRDALQRMMLIPWRRAKTWEGMKMTIDAQFQGLEGDAIDSQRFTDIVNVRYHLYVSLPSSLEPLKRKASKSSSSRHHANGSNAHGPDSLPTSESQRNAGEGSSHNETNGLNSRSNSTDANNQDGTQPQPRTMVPEAPSPHMRPMIILPEFWDEIIQPGSFVTMTMWRSNPRAAFDVPIPGMPPPAPGMGMTNAPAVGIPPMAPPHPRFIRVIDLNRNSRPKTRAKSSRPRKMID